MKKAIVTLCVGAKYVNLFDSYCRENWQAYCEKFGYDLIVVEEFLDFSERAKKRSPAWQKLLILSQEWATKYDRIVWVDADIIINSRYATDIADGVPLEKVGAVDEYAIPTREMHAIALDRLYDFWDKSKISYIDNKHPNSYYTNRGIKANGFNEVVQAGVMVCSPKYHREIFEHVYNSYEDAKGGSWNYEMPVLSYELIKANMVHWISPRFNFSVMHIMATYYPETLFRRRRLSRRIVNRVLRPTRFTYKSKSELNSLKKIYDLSIFMHFAGCADLMQKF